MPLLAQSGHSFLEREYPLSGIKRTYRTSRVTILRQTGDKPLKRAASKQTPFGIERTAS